MAKSVALCGSATRPFDPCERPLAAESLSNRLFSSDGSSSGRRADAPELRAGGPSTLAPSIRVRRSSNVGGAESLMSCEKFVATTNYDARPVPSPTRTRSVQSVESRKRRSCQARLSKAHSTAAKPNAQRTDHARVSHQPIGTRSTSTGREAGWILATAFAARGRAEAGGDP